MDFNFTNADLANFKSRGIQPDAVREQMNNFRNGFPFLKLAGSATVGKGIMKLTPDQEQRALARWEKYLADGGTVTKFVPASGAASRMFKSLFAFVEGESEIPAPGSDVEKLLEKVEELPFREQLDKSLLRQTGLNVLQLKSEGRLKEIVSAIISPSGMNYGQLPKGLLGFHRYESGEVRTPVEEQMAEGALTAASNGKVKLHFTVSGDHKMLFTKKIEEVKPRFEHRFGVKYDISLSEQKKSTDTVAADPDNSIFRDDNGNIVFRPGGHGALIENLSDIDSTVVFVKNIDNVVPDNQRDITIKYKKIIAGVLIEAHDRISEYLHDLRQEVSDRRKLNQMLDFLEVDLCTKYEGARDMDDATLAKYLESKFNRPLRVCGMVVNEGEPGGGPYLAYNKDGSYSPQILESTQIDTTDSEAAGMMSKATHFNPVDLVCYIKDIDGNPFKLKDFIDKNTGFISSKSFNGKELRALELPGLWNGAMSDWSTIFVEVPAATFNPVKTVNDLLRPVHQADK